MSQEQIAITPGRGQLNVDPKMASLCLTCGTCAGGCPVTGIDGMDPASGAHGGLGVGPGADRFPLAVDLYPVRTLRARCPMGIEIVAMTRKARSLRERDKVPGPIHKGTMMNLKRGNNLGIPTFDFLFLLSDLSKELDGECCPGFYVPVDKKGARVVTTINSKEPFGNPTT